MTATDHLVTVTLSEQQAAALAATAKRLLTRENTPDVYTRNLAGALRQIMNARGRADLRAEALIAKHSEVWS